MANDTGVAEPLGPWHLCQRRAWLGLPWHSPATHADEEIVTVPLPEKQPPLGQCCLQFHLTVSDTNTALKMSRKRFCFL